MGDGWSMGVEPISSPDPVPLQAQDRLSPGVGNAPRLLLGWRPAGHAVSRDTMRVFVFRSGRDPELLGLTLTSSNPPLPKDQGPWVFWQWPRLSSLSGVNAANAEADIKAKGFHLSRGSGNAPAP